MEEITFYSVKNYERDKIKECSKRWGIKVSIQEETYQNKRPNYGSTKAICLFVEDRMGAEDLADLKDRGVNIILLRCKGYDNIDIESANKLAISVFNTDYPQTAIVEHTLALILALNRRLKRSIFNLMEGNFSLDNLISCDLRVKKAGIVGTGAIGSKVLKTLKNLGMRTQAYDIYQNQDLLESGVKYVSTLEELFATSHVISLHCPGSQKDGYLVDKSLLAHIKQGSILVNTARGSLLDTRAAIELVNEGRIAGLGIDVYEYEDNCFYKNYYSLNQDPTLLKLIVDNNVIITPHQAFLSEGSLDVLINNLFQNYTSIIEENDKD